MARTCLWTVVGAMILGTACLTSLFLLDWDPEDQPPRRGLYWDVDRDRERDREQELENLRKDLFGREARRTRLAQDVIDQRITLRQAMVFLREIESGGVSAAHYSYMLRSQYPGKTIEESLFRKVIALVKEVLKAEPERYARVHARLQAELEKEPEPSVSLQSPAIRTPVRVQE